MNDEDYQKVMSFHYAKKINEYGGSSYNTDWDIKKQFIGKDKLDKIETLEGEIKKLKIDALNTKESNYEEGQIINIEITFYDQKFPWLNSRLTKIFPFKVFPFSNIKIVKVNEKSLGIEYYGRDYHELRKDYDASIKYGIEYSTEKDPKYLVRQNVSKKKFTRWYMDLISTDEYNNSLSSSVLRKVNESKRDIQNQLDELLDKISDGGFDSLSKGEKEFMKSFKQGNQKDHYEKLNKKVYNDGNFEFELDRVEYAGEDRRRFYGTLKIGDKVLKGYITRLSYGSNDIQFNDKDGLTIWDHADGFEYYLDDFIENIVIDNE